MQVNIIDYERQTGRTTRMLCVAIFYSLKNTQNTFVVCLNYKHSRNLYNKTLSMLGDGAYSKPTITNNKSIVLPNGSTIRFITYDKYRDESYFCGINNPIIYVDHTVYEYTESHK